MTASSPARPPPAPHAAGPLEPQAQLCAGDNPATGIPQFREERRDRFLNPDELSRALLAIDQDPAWRWRANVRLALLLGPGRQELLRARSPELDLSARTWRLPTTKAGASTRPASADTRARRE